MNCGLIVEMAADPDAGMETCPSPEIGDSRKRPLDSDTDNGASKRSHFSSGKYLHLNDLWLFLYIYLMQQQQQNKQKLHTHPISVE